MSDWLPNIDQAHGSLYLAIVDAMERDVAVGALPKGSKLPPQRDLAKRMQLSIGTVSRAYAEAERRGLVSGEVGRGTFIMARLTAEAGDNPVRARSVNLALNIPPSTGETDLIAGQLVEIAQLPDLSSLLGYLPHQGLPRHRTAIAGWLSSHALPAQSDAVIITPGAQHALDISCRLLARPGDTILAESLTFSGMVSLANHADYRMAGVEMDADGLIPDALDAAFERTGARVVYATPTLQSPTGTVMPLARRVAIAEILRRRDAYLIEDDAYSFLPTQPVTPIAAMAPERVFYIVSFAKCLAPALRVGALVPPIRFRDRAIAAMRATGWMAPPLMSEMTARLIISGEMADQARRKRARASTRYHLAGQILAGLASAGHATPGFHIWLPLPPDRSLASLITQSAAHGITLGPPAASGGVSAPPGLRLCLGVDVDDDVLAEALKTIRQLVVDADMHSVV